jgi:ABC-type Co2+ transport system permease subunit
MLFYAVQVLNGLRLKLPWYLWADNLFHAIVGGCMTLMLYAYAKPDSPQAVTKPRKVITFAVLTAFIVSGVPGVPLPGGFGHVSGRT